VNAGYGRLAEHVGRQQLPQRLNRIKESGAAGGARHDSRATDV